MATPTQFRRHRGLQLLSPAAVRILGTPEFGLQSARSVLLFLFPTRNFYWGRHGVRSQIEASHGSLAGLLHPNHLPTIFWDMRHGGPPTACGLAVRALFVLQALNAFFAAGTVFLIRNILLELTGVTRRSAWGTAAFRVRLKLVEVCGRCGCIYPFRVFLDAVFPAAAARGAAETLGAALSHSAAMLFHELAVLVLSGGCHYVDRLQAPRGRERLQAKPEHGRDCVQRRRPDDNRHCLRTGLFGGAPARRTPGILELDHDPCAGCRFQISAAGSIEAVGARHTAAVLWRQGQ